MSSSSKWVFAGLLLATWTSGCLVDDVTGRRGQSAAPAATVPDTGSPVRRESPTKTLRDADAERRPAREGGADLNVGSSPGEAPVGPAAQ